MSRSPQWVWTAIDPVTKLLLTINVGDRTLAMAQSVVHQVVQVLAPGCVPLFLTDGFKEYATALLTHFGQWVQPERRQATGPTPQAALDAPPPAALCAGGQDCAAAAPGPRAASGRVRHPGGGPAVLAACGWQINTAFVERLNLSLRQHVAAIGRRVSTLCKGEDGLRQQLALYHVYYNFCLPHASLRQPLLQPEPDPRHGLGQKLAPLTPAMAAGLTDHVWTLREVLLFRVPPWPQPAGVEHSSGGGKR